MKYSPSDIELMVRADTSDVVAYLGDALSIVPRTILAKSTDHTGVRVNYDKVRTLMFPALMNAIGTSEVRRSIADNTLEAMRMAMITGTAVYGIDMAAEDTEYMRADLILAGDEKEAMEFARFCGMNNWVYLANYRMCMNYRGSKVYIVGGGRDRVDFPAIEGLFIQCDISVTDMEA